MAKSVSRCASQASRLWTCTRSKRSTPQKRRDCSICEGPSAAEEVQTFSAENSVSGRPSLSRPYPITGCEEPYMGEESIIFPPASKNAVITSAHSSRSTGSSPTLKVIQVPRPTAGIASPEDGMVRVRAHAPGPTRPRQCESRSGSSSSLHEGSAGEDHSSAILSHSSVNAGSRARGFSESFPERRAVEGEANFASRHPRPSKRRDWTPPAAGATIAPYAIRRGPQDRSASN